MFRALPARRWHLVIGIAGLAAAGILALREYTHRRAAPGLSSDRSIAAVPTRDLDAAVCAQCHAGIAKKFRETGMGRSFYRLTPATVVEDFKSGKPFYHEPSNTYFSMLERGGKYYQRRWQAGFEGKEANVDEKQIDYVMGSGNHGRTYLHLTNRNTLQQLPLGWYAEKGGYLAMNPGYDKAEYQGSTRAIHYECMFCHNAYPGIPAGHAEAGAEAQYLQPLPEGIDCNRCHGPGRRHVEIAQKAGARREEIRAAIVNPARLAPEREMEVCMACHLETTSRLLPHAIQRLERGPFSWTPGEKLADFRFSFDRAPGKNEDFEVAHQAYRLRESQCFLKSAGKLRCTTCHDPHDIPRGDAATSHYNQVCRTCHADTVKPAALHLTGVNCVGCHMPRRRTDDAVHIVMTDHKIVRQKPPGDLLAEKNEVHESPATSYRGPVVPYYPEKGTTADSPWYVAMAQVMDRSNLEAGLPKLANLIEKDHPTQAGYYSAAAEAYHAAGNGDRAIQLLEQAPASEIVLLRLGDLLQESGQWAKAEAAFRRAKELRPDDAAAWGQLGWVLWQQGKTAEARSCVEKGIALNPDLPDLHNYLASISTGTGDIAGAEREFREAIRINPGIAEWRENLAKLLAAHGDKAEAVYQFEQSIRIKPDYAPARLNYARLLANDNRLAEAEKQARAAVDADPSSGAAHEILGYLLSEEKDYSGAVRELQAALRSNPDSGRAHYELGVALGRMGSSQAAREQLILATQGNDPQARAAASEVLRRLGR